MNCRNLWPWVSLVAGGAATLAAVGAYYGTSEELLNRSLIAAGSLWLVWRSRAAFATASATATSRVLGIVVLTLASLATPPAWYLLAQAGPRPILVWWLTLASVATAAGAILIVSGWRALRALAFPLLFVLFTLPTPQRFERPLQTFLQRCTTTASAASLEVLGFPCKRHGYVLSLPAGDLGVIEACSGIRSVTALTAVAAFIAYWRGMGLVRGSVFVVLGLPIIVSANVLRITVSGVLQESIGPEAVRGSAHELLGLSVVLVSLACLIGLARVFGRARRPADVRPLAPADPSPLRIGPRLVFAFPAVALFASLVAAGLALRGSERPPRPAPLEEIATNLGAWRGEDSPIPHAIPETLGYDRVLHRVYRNAIGQDVRVWVIFWSRIRWDRGYHHPDLCLGNQGWSLADRQSINLPVSGNDNVPVTLRRFRNGDRSQLVCYWTQEGTRVWTDADEADARSGGSHRWVSEGLKGRVQSREARISVLIETELWGANHYSEDALLSFCRRFAAELYRVIPWAIPKAE